MDHHHQHRDDDENRPDYYPPPDTAARPPQPHPSSFHQPPPQPPHYYQEQPRPYYDQQTNVHHTSPVNYQDPYFPSNYQPPPPPPPRPQAEVTHVSHEHTHHSFHPHLPSVFPHEAQSGIVRPELDLSNKPSVKIYCKAGPNFLLSIRDGKIVLTRSDPSDPFQKWWKDEKYATRVKDEEGCPCFALVNKATGQAMKHSLGATHPVQLIPYNPDTLDESILWTESKDLGDGYRTIRMVNNIRLNVDAFHGDKKSGGVHDGTTIVLWDWNKGDNQRWKIAPQLCKFAKNGHPF